MLGPGFSTTFSSSSRRAMAMTSRNESSLMAAISAVGMDAREKQHLRLVDVANAGDHALIEEHIRDRLGRPCAHASKCFLRVKRVGEQIRAKRCDRAMTGKGRTPG